MKAVLASILLFLSAHCMAQSLNDLIIRYESQMRMNNSYRYVQWPAVSAEDDKSKQDFFETLLKDLNRIDAEKLALTEQINHELLVLIANDEIAKRKFFKRYIPLSAEGGFITSMLSTSRSSTKKGEAISQYVSKLDDTPRYIRAQIANLKSGMAADITVPKMIAQNCLDILTNALEKDPTFLRNPLPKDYNYDYAPIAAALNDLKQYLKTEYIPNTRASIGIRENSNGKEYYEQRVRYFTTLDMTPEEVYEVGQAEVKRIRKEMEDIIAGLKFEGSFEDFIHFLRTDPQFYAETPEELLKEAAWLTVKAQEMLPRYFTILPSLPVTVNPVPAAIAPTYTTGRYASGSFESRKAGEYWVNTYNLASRPLYALPALTLHEAVPGHHLQISLAKELKDIPDFRKRYYLSAFGEGWGLYSEYLGKEAGIYSTAYQDFGRLTYEMWRACRLVVDPGMHYLGWTRDQAVEFMKNNTALSIHNVNTEIDRYIGWPGQAVSYKIGEIHIKNLRKMAEEALGERFDIRDFHDTLIANGSVPLSTLTKIIEEWVGAVAE